MKDSTKVTGKVSRKSKTRPTGIDLFAGAGGLALGFEQAGFDVLAAVEYDPVHAGVHSFNFPHSKVLCRNIATLRGQDVVGAAAEGWKAHKRPGSLRGRIDVVFGGPPCQGFSSIGKRLVDDERNQLVFHFFRLITEIRPRYFVMENVPGMMAGGHSGILAELVREFELSGYAVRVPPQVLNAADHGVPQNRKRLFLMGADQGETLPEYPTPQTARASAVHQRGGDFQLAFSGAVDLPSGPTVAEAIRDLPDLDSFAELLTKDSTRLAKRDLSRIEKTASEYAQVLRGQAKDTADLSYPRKWDREVMTSSLRTEHTKVSVRRFAATAQGEVEPISRYLRLPEDGLCNTLRAGTGSERGAYTSPRPIHPTLPRVISVREAARLHSFPDWFRFHKTKWHGFRQVGNSVPPLLGRAVASAVVRALGLVPTKPSAAIPLGDEALLEMTMAESATLFGASFDSIPQPRSRPEMAG